MPAVVDNQFRSITLPSTGKIITIAPPNDKPDVKGQKRKDDDKWWLLLLLITAADIAQAEKYWRLYAPASFAGMLGHTNGFGFDEPTQRWTKRGKAQDDEESRAVYLAFLAKATADIEKQAGRMARGRIPLDVWEESHAQAIKSLYIVSDAFGRSGIDFVDPSPKQPTPQPIKDIPPVDLPGALNDSTARLKRFGVSLEAGEAGTVTTIIRRAGLYADPAHGVMELARRESHGDATNASGVKIEWLEQNVLDDLAAHCKTEKHTMGCPEITDAGKAPIGTYDPPGTRTCASKCRCHMAYSVAAPNKLSDVTQKHFAPGTRNPMAMSATREVKLSGGRTVTIPLALAGDSDWATINGVHVHFGKDGKIDKGPVHMVGKTAEHVHQQTARKHISDAANGAKIEIETQNGQKHEVAGGGLGRITPAGDHVLSKDGQTELPISAVKRVVVNGQEKWRHPDYKQKSSAPDWAQGENAKRLSLSANPRNFMPSEPRIVNLKSGKTITIPVLALSAGDDDSPKMSAKADKKSATSFEMASKKTDDDYNPKEAQKSHLDARAAHMEAARSHDMAGGREMAMHHRQCANIHDCMAAKA